jgi:hypothetical protein
MGQVQDCLAGRAHAPDGTSKTRSQPEAVVFCAVPWILVVAKQTLPLPDWPGVCRRYRPSSDEVRIWSTGWGEWDGIGIGHDSGRSSRAIPESVYLRGSGGPHFQHRPEVCDTATLHCRQELFHRPMRLQVT